MNKSYLDAAIVFHNILNPQLWDDGDMKPQVRETLLAMASEFREFLGLDDLDVKDITVSGSNAAYTYTPHSDIDLHLVVAIPEKLENLYLELFDAKKNLYNLTRNQKIKGFDVEFYVQPAESEVESMGIYSVLKGKWISFPKKVKAHINDQSVKSKVEKYKTKIEQMLRDGTYEDALAVWTEFKNMRQAGLERGGEFSPENLAFKILRTQGLQKALFDKVIELKDSQLSLESLQEQRIDELFKSTINYQVVKSTPHKFSTLATVGNRSIKFNAVTSSHLDYQGQTVWEVDFQEINQYGKSYAKTNSGNEFEVFGMVMKSMKEFVATYHPYSMCFNASTEDSDARASLYDRLLKRYLPSDYKVTKQSVGQHFEYFITKAVD